MPLSVAGPTCETVQVAPPSADRATVSGVGSARPSSWLRNDAQQTYTRPKNGLLAWLSAYTCSLSENVVLDCLEITVGAIHADALPAAAADTSSVRETAIPSKPLIVPEASKFEVRFA